MVSKTKTFSFNHFNLSKFIFVGILFVLSSCIPNQTNTRGLNNSAENSVAAQNGGQTENQPIFFEQGNFLDNGIVQSYSISEVSVDSRINILLRGQQVHSYLTQSSNGSEVVCAVTRIVEEVPNKWLVVAASPGQLFNYKTATKEFYYSLSINGETVNRTFCQKSGIIAALASLYPFDSIAYSLDTICENCSAQYFNTSTLKLYGSSGFSISNVDVSSLRFKINNQPSSIATGNSCTSASQCQSAGFDCCSNEGFCINDKTLKFGTDQTSNEFLQAQNDIQLNSNNIYNYPNFYNLCPIVVQEETSSTSTQGLNADELAALNFEKLQDLYNCTTLLKGEMSICTIEYDNATEQTPNIFYTADDDRNFVNTYSGTINIPQHSIVEVEHSEQTLYKDGTFLRPGEVEIGANNNQLGNDSLTDPALIELNRNLSSSALNDIVKIRYKIDGSCEYINSNSASCKKFYTQGQNTGDVNDHFPASNIFKIPEYADLNKNITVRVDGVIKFNGIDWNINTFNGISIEFIGNDLMVYDNQEVVIDYFADLTSNNVFNSKKIALEKIKQMCSCADFNCRLKPFESVVNGKNVVTNYICDYPEPDLPPAPQQQLIMLSSKTVPMRYFDENGAAQSTITSETLKQEGVKFEYINNDLLRPNNVTQHIGMQEVFGSFTTRSEAARPAKEVRVDQGKVYDIFVDSGSLSTCFNCGVDYHSLIAKIFPSNFLHRGGGWEPLDFQTNRKTSTEYRADDILFGRACFIPPTMIPWTHKPTTSVQRQRMNRLETQHFLFANGYNRDWYGFDYGSVIGSFDGVKWFSIGNQRRIKADGHKLFLAVNAYFGDLSMESTFQVSIIDSTISRTSLGSIQSDFESDGAQCQKYHQCSDDKDCVSKLGWDYTCENISTLSTNWPEFDGLGNEISDREINTRLYALFNASAGGAKRCVYRGRGTPCSQEMTFASEDQSFNGGTSPGLLSCSQNNYCQEFIQGAKAKRFNLKISRYGKPPASQNLSSFVEEDDLDTFGLHARYTGRPYSYTATEEITDVALNNTSHNNVLGACLPGRNPEALTVKTSLSSNPSNDYLGDKVLNLGVTVNALEDSSLLSSCPVIDTDDELYHFKSTNINASLNTANNSELYGLTAGQNLSTAHLDIFESIRGEKITQIFEKQQITTRTLEDNRCLRAPGSTCFTDLDCSSNDFVSNFVNKISSRDTNATSVLNKHEIEFWQEKLVCSQEFATTDDNYDHSRNRCCRETGNSITVPTLINQTGYSINNRDDTLVDFDNKSIPGIDISLDNVKRYSRNAVSHYERNQDSTKFPPLEAVGKNKCQEGGCQSTALLTNQFHTMDLIAQKTCCNKNWVRNFHEDNGGGHRWAANKMQSFDKKNFKCYNWAGYDGNQPADAANFSCSHVEDPNDPGCYVRNLSSPIFSPILELMGEIELLGVPQIAVKSYQHDSMQCTTNITNQFSPLVFTILPGVFSDDALVDATKAEYSDEENKIRFSAIDKSNFHSDLKMIFSPDKVSCCIPSGEEVPEGTDRDQCCSGFIDETTSTCALPDFADISVYFNRYISSEAKALSDTLFDKQTGYIKDTATTITLACQKKVCASGCVALGVGVTRLAIPGHEENPTRFTRFIDGDDADINNKNGFADYFNNGLKWNNHAYCFPAGEEGCQSDSPDLILTQCQ